MDARSEPRREFEEIRCALVGQHPLIWVLTWEEARFLGFLRAFVASSGRPLPIFTWSMLDGLVGPQGPLAGTEDPLVALDRVESQEGPGFHVFVDLAPLLEDAPERFRLVRRLRDLYRQLRDRGRHLLIVSPRLVLPEELQKDVHVVRFDPPGEEELGRLLQRMMERHQPDRALPLALACQVVRGMRGLTHDEATHVLHRCLASRRDISDGRLLDDVLAEKEQIARKEGVLEFVPPRWSLEDVGGLENLKQWLNRRARLFGEDARAAGIPLPRGVLLMGMSGCGKSLSVKTISSLWNLPLFRLDINRVFSGEGGNAESRFRRALLAAEAMAPCVLWIDEIEMGVAGYREGDGGATSRIFSTFLTWMQEKRGLVFVAATANRIHLLPAEIIRKGRFDQVFFVDLPSEEERKEIFSVHLKRLGLDSTAFDVVFLAKSTRGWNGAEIEQCVAAASIDAFSSERCLEEGDLYREIGRTVPLSVTMEEQMKAIKNWAHDRAVPASPPQRS